MRKSPYTLIELVAVIMIVALVTGIVVTQRNRIPAFVSLESTAQKIQLFMARATLMATSQGKTISVSLDPASGHISAAGASSEETGGAPPSYKLPSGVSIAGTDEKLVCNFYPDGTSSGTPVELSLKGHVIRIKISKLTGVATIEREK